MRRPTTREEAWAFWKTATASGNPARFPRPVDSEPQAGLYAMRKWRDPANPWRPGPWVPAQISIRSEICAETGELLKDETPVAEIDGRPASALTVWSYGRIVTRQEWEWLTAQSPLLPKTPEGCVGP